MPNVEIGDNVRIEKAIIGTGAVINYDCVIGDGEEISVIAAKQCVTNKVNLEYKEIIYKDEILI